MAATRRLQKELQDLRQAGLKNFRDIQVDEQNILQWQGLLVSDRAPYAKGAFRIDIQVRSNIGCTRRSKNALFCSKLITLLPNQYDNY